MECIRQISSLEKIRSAKDIPEKELKEITLFRGEQFSYQITISWDSTCPAFVTAESDLGDCVKLYDVKNIIMDKPLEEVNSAGIKNADEDYITREAGLMPDLLMPVCEQKGKVLLWSGITTVWVTLDIPCDAPEGKHYVKVFFEGQNSEKGNGVKLESELCVNIVAKILEKPSLPFTQWFHVDCTASAHNVEIYSERHWSIIEEYIKTAAELGINLILTPVISPPLDNAVGTARPKTQLTRIEKVGDEYSFDFSLLKRWIDVCHKWGIENFEICQLFSQWGAAYAPNIWVTENGEEKHMFGWHVEANSCEYKNFLVQFVPALVKWLKEEGIFENCRFHLSDEPRQNHLEAYRYAYNLVKPMLDGGVIMDAMSDFDFYQNGLMENPVSSSNHIEPFLEDKTENLWAYYCTSQGNQVGNRFFAMPSYRNRILGLQLYKYDIKGFLHWGYNFYYSSLSHFPINPYQTSSAAGAFQSGDPYSVYPYKDSCLKSLRGVIFYEALQDIEICRMLEKKLGRKAVVEMIDKEAGMDITFKEYPRNSEFIPSLMAKMKKMIAE